MKITINGQIAIRPITFPAVVEIRVFPLSREDDRWLGGSFPMDEHKSWEWVRSHYLVREDYFIEAETFLKQGQTANLVRGPVTLILPDDAVVPAEAIIP